MTSISDTEVVNAPGGLVELGYTTASTTITITATGGTTLGTTTGIVGPLTVVCDGSPIIVEFYTPYVYPAAIAGAFVNFVIFKNGAFAGFVGSTQTPAASTDSKTMFFQWRDTPTVGTHTFEIRAYRDGGGGTAQAIGSGPAGWASTFIRVSKIIQASQLLVTQSNAPIVTSLPSGNLVTGQEVDLYVTTPYAGYQRHKWDGSAWYIIGDSRSVGAWQSWTPTITQGGNVAYTLSRARYVINGKTVQMMMGGTITGSGTSGNAISISLPTPAFTGVNFLTGRTGTFHYYRSATGFRYTGILELNTSTSAVMVSEETGGNALGASPSFSAGVNDQIAITATYEVS